MSKPPEQEHEHDQQFLKQIGVANEELIYPERVLTEEERWVLELRWRALIARS